MSVMTPKTLLKNTNFVCGLTHSFIKWTNLTWSQMGDLSKIVFFSKTSRKPCYLQIKKTLYYSWDCWDIIHLLDLKGQIKVTISEKSIIQYIWTC